MPLLSRILGRTKRDRETNAKAAADEVPHRGRRVDDAARGELEKAILPKADHDPSRREALRWGMVAGGGVLAGVLAERLIAPALAAPGDAIGGTTISDTDIDAKRIAGIRIATEFAPAKHAGTSADPIPGSAIQAALDNTLSTGGIVFVPSGVYNVANPLNITKSNVTLLGTGFASHLLTDGTGFTDNESGLIQINGQYKGIALEGLYVDGVDLATTDTCRGLIVTGGSEVFVRTCAFVNWLGTLSQRGRGLTVVHNPNTEAPPHKGVRVEGCYFWNNQIGVVMHRCIYTVLNSYFEQNVWDGIYTEGTSRGAIVGNLFTFAPRTGVFLIFNDRQTVVGNRIEDCGSGIQVYEGRGMSMIGNHIERCASAGIDIRTNSAHCVASGNFVGYCSGVPGIQLLTNVTECIVTDNILRGNRDGVASLASSNARIAGNACLENSRSGIYVHDSNHIRILANRASSQPYGILADGDTDWLMVKDNDLRGNTTAAKALVGSNVILADNWET